MRMALTGHRPEKLGGYRSSNPMIRLVRNWIGQVFDDFRPSVVISGLAQGFDTWGALEALERRIPLIGAVPCDDQDAKWFSREVEVYRYLLEHCDDVCVVSPGPYVEGKMQLRNKWMVERSDFLVGLWDGSPGGTRNCIEYAIKRQRSRLIVRPEQLRKRVLYPPIQ